MTTFPLVSVIIPNYNHARFLRERIESVLSQEYPNIEILYLDDASTDNSAEVFAGYRDDKRISAHCNARNTGNPFVQWNKGVRLARGKYIWIAEADDYSAPSFLRRLVEILEANPRAGIAYSQSDVVGENGEFVVTGDAFTNSLDPARWKAPFIADGRSECANYMYIKNTIPNASAVVFRRDVYEAAGGADESYRLCGDWLLWCRMLLQSDIAFIPDRLNYFRQHRGTVRSAQTKQGRNFDELLLVRAEIQRSIQIDNAAIQAAALSVSKKIAVLWCNGIISPVLWLAMMRHGFRMTYRFPLMMTMSILRETGQRVKQVMVKLLQKNQPAA